MQRNETSRTSFVNFLSFQSMTQSCKKCKKLCIRCQDSNSQPIDDESPPLTTNSTSNIVQKILKLNLRNTDFKKSDNQFK